MKSSRMAGRVAAWLLMLMAVTAATAQISLSTAVDLALKNDPRVKMAESDLKKAEAGLAQSYDVYVPKIALDAGYGRGIGVPTGLPTILTITSQSLVFNFSQRDNVRSAAAALEAAKLALQETRDGVAEDVISTYMNLASDQRRREATMDEYGYAQRLITIVQERVNAEQDTRTNLLLARRTATQIELEKLHLEDETSDLAHRLSLLLGLPDRPLEAVPDSIPPLASVAAINNDGLQLDSFGVRAAFQNAKSRRQYAFGLGRYTLRPQIGLNLNYSRIDTAENAYTEYYPNFAGKSNNAESVYLSLQLPIFDRMHQDLSRQANADAVHAEREAEQQRNQFLDGRFKLRHVASELSLRCELAEIDRDLATQQMQAVLTQQSADAAGLGRVLTPKDEQNARIEERARTIDLLRTQLEFDQARVSLLRQTGQLDPWLKSALGIQQTSLRKAARP